MRVAALVVALFAIIIGVVGIVAPDSLTMARQHLLARPGVVLYVAGPIRVAMGLVLIVFAPRSRTPRILRVLGVIMPCKESCRSSSESIASECSSNGKLCWETWPYVPGPLWP
jgi:hypothetical protein